MKYLFAILAVFALSFQAQAQDADLTIVLKAVGFSEAKWNKVSPLLGKKYGTVDISQDTTWNDVEQKDSVVVWNISPVPNITDSLLADDIMTYTIEGTRLDSIVSHYEMVPNGIFEKVQGEIKEVRTPRSITAQEMRSEWRKQMFDLWETANRDSIRKANSEKLDKMLEAVKF